jgi:hypothetical protein
MATRDQGPPGYKAPGTRGTRDQGHQGPGTPWDQGHQGPGAPGNSGTRDHWHQDTGYHRSEAPRTVGARAPRAPGLGASEARCTRAIGIIDQGRMGTRGQGHQGTIASPQIEFILKEFGYSF